MTDTEILDFLEEKKFDLQLNVSGEGSWFIFTLVDRDQSTGEPTFVLVEGDDIRDAVRESKKRFYDPMPPDDGYIRLPAVRQMVRVVGNSSWKGHCGVVCEVQSNYMTPFVVVDFRDGNTASFRPEDVETVGDDPKFVLIPK